MVASFSGKVQTDQQTNEAHIKELNAKIGQLALENDFLQRAFAKIWAQREGEG